MLGPRADCSAELTCTLTWETARLPVRVYAGPSAARIDRSTPVAIARTANAVTFTDPDPGHVTYFEVVPRNARRGPIVGDQYVGLDGAPNTRDLGGYNTVDGRRVRWGRLFRTDGLAEITAADRTRLATVGLPTTCPTPEDPTLPVDDATLSAVSASVTTADARARDGALLRALARGPLPQWVQCTLLDDRSGWPAALVLTTLGVSRETIVADHLASARTGAAPAPERKYVDAAFEAIRRRYKTFGRYLGRGLGLDQRTYDRLRARYTIDERA